jgi:bifunctional N-acetylglucosamine-1-phosphate-uridyltransferase/glucosamine-1-phosphate-acetyltransferase GlmU-like protein
MIHPGVILHGDKTVIGPCAKIGTEGPATLMNAAVGRNAEIASGFVTEAAILPNARLGSNSHVRSGTLLEEWASTAHSVGLKHTVLMSFVTVGSLINLCDFLVSGGVREENTRKSEADLSISIFRRARGGGRAAHRWLWIVGHSGLNTP